MFARLRKSHHSDLGVLEHSLTGLTTASRRLDISNDKLGPLGLQLLYAPPAPLLEFIFVHGLRGGSRKTWSKSSDPYYFWPKDWLPRDPGFKHVRIHSFGYNSDWGQTKDSVLNIHDFGKQLLAEIMNSPDIRKDGDTPIVFIGHSMGGLVIKKVCILANQDPSTKPLADRIYGLVFLATPHRGSDSATMLKNILRASPYVSGQKPFVNDLERNSSALQVINDEFRHISGKFQINSFYETLKTNTGVSSILIVSKDSATLGYPNEESAMLNATHRGICKFDSPLDPNFVSLRNALATMAREITQKVTSTRLTQHRGQLRDLQNFLGVSETPDDNLTDLEEAQSEGSCHWFTWKKPYQAWRDCYPSTPSHYWLSAQPAAGKSVMAAHVVRNLEDVNSNCSYYFFGHNDTAVSSLSACLRSLAYQMALLDQRIWQLLVTMNEDNTHFDKDNELAVWRKVFVNGVFELSLEQPHFWVIDGLDECSSRNNIVTMIGKANLDFPLRVFMTSRPTAEIAGWFAQLENSIYADQMTMEDTRDDIELYIRVNIKNLPLQNEIFRQKVAESILEKSQGSFLWVRLVLREMRAVFSESDIQRVLDEVPPGMDSLYERALVSMSQTSRGKHLIKAILQWAVCATRPLTVEELQHALKLDTGESVLNLETFITLTCEQLVHVDKGGKVLLIHETVRAFLLRQDLQSEFAFNRSDAHGRIVDICLQYLNSDEMRPPRNQRLMQLYRAKVKKRSAFVGYACSYFGYHLRRSSSENAHRFIQLCEFLHGNVCSWIEQIARGGHLQYMIRTANDLKCFLQARAKYYSPLGQNVQYADSWESDLIRLAAQFGRNLTEYPSAIFWLIPPFCPPMTAIRSQFKSTPHGITLYGLSLTTWSDRISCIHYRDKQARAVACTATSFAVGLSDKSIELYSRSTCQELQQLQNLQPAKLLAFSDSGKLMAVSSVHYITMFNVGTGEQMWQTRLLQECLALIYVDQDKILWLVTKGGILLSLLVSDGSTLSSVTLAPGPEEEAGFRRVFTSAAFSLELNMVAAVHRGRPIGLYDMESGSFFADCERDFDAGLEETDFAATWIRDFIFTTVPEISFIAALYHDGDLALFDPCETGMKTCVQANAQVLACSPNGRWLATGNDTGTVQIFELEGLNLMYKIIGSDHSIKSIAFSHDGLRFVDIRGSQCNIWEPPVLLHAGPGESSSVSDTVAIEPAVVGVADTERLSEITALECHAGGEYFFCGKENGSVALYSTSNGREVQMLYKHAQGIAINFLTWGEKSKILVSADASSRYMAWRIVQRGHTWAAEGPLLDDRIQDHSISQLLFDPENKYLLVSTIVSDTMYDLTSSTNSIITFPERHPWKWVNHPRDPSKLLHITPNAAHIHTWNSLSEPQSSHNMKLPSGLGMEMSLKNAAACSDGCKLAVEFSRPHSPQSTSHTLILSITSLGESSADSDPSLMLFSSVSPHIEHLIGSLGHRLVFLDRRMWICSLDLEAFKGEYYRHCFIPDEWLNANWNLRLEVTSKGDLVFVKKSEIAVIKNALDNREILVSLSEGVVVSKP